MAENNDGLMDLVPLQRAEPRPLPLALRNMPLKTLRDHHKFAAKVVRFMASGQIERELGTKLIWSIATTQKMLVLAELEGRVVTLEELVNGSR